MRSKTPDLAITHDDKRLSEIAERAGDMTVVAGFVEETLAIGGEDEELVVADLDYGNVSRRCLRTRTRNRSCRFAALHYGHVNR